jgi:hypothetical protein
LKILIKNKVEFSSELLFKELTKFFDLKGLKLLNEEMSAIQVNFQEVQEEIKGNLIKCLDDESFEKIIKAFREQLLPLLVNAYPLNARARIFEEASDKVKLKNFIIAEGNKLQSIGNMEGPAIDALLSKLVKDPLPEQINADQEVDKAKEFFTTQLKKITKKGVVSLIATKLFAPSSWSLYPSYNYDKSIADFLRSEEFLNNISIMLPYDQWLKLKADISKNYPALIAVARALIDQQTSDNPKEPSAEELLALLNKHLKTNYISSVEALETTKTTLGTVIKEITDNPLDHISPDLKNKFNQIGLNQLLPLLTNFIKDETKKALFMGIKQDPALLYEFIVKNAEELSTLMAGDEDTIKRKALRVINQLLPQDKVLELTDIQNPELFATSVATLMEKDLQQGSLIAFLTSDLFHDLLRASFNPEDYKLVMSSISAEGRIKALAVTISANGDDIFNKEGILKAIKASDPRLSSIETLEARMTTFKTFITDVSDNGTKHLDKNKLSAAVADYVTPVLFHKKFIQTIDNLIGFLDEKDLTVIFDSLKEKEPALKAKQFLRFISLIKQQNKEAFTKEFITLPKDTEDFNFDNLPAKKMLDSVQSLIEEVLDSHCYYNNQDRKGFVGRGQKPKLHDKLSAEVAAMTIPDGHSFFAGFSRKIFYIQGIKKGLPAGGEVNADSNQHLVKTLERVKSHILRPLWWGTNVSQLTHSFIKGCRDFIHGAAAGWYGVVNGFKSVLNWATRSSYFNISTKHEDSKDFNDTSFDFADKVNKLDPFAAEQVKDKDCPVDAVTDLEHFVDSRPARKGFFGGSLGSPVSSSEEEQQTSEQSPTNSPK